MPLPGTVVNSVEGGRSHKQGRSRHFAPRSPVEPWFGPQEQLQRSAASGRRLLLISYHFPPDPAVGGLRWQQLSRYLAKHGWGIDVITRDLDLLRSRDDARLEMLPQSLR